MDVIDFIQKANEKILSLSKQFNTELSKYGESCLWKDVYLLSEAIYVVNSDITSNECKEKIITKLNGKYSLDSLEPPIYGGISEMTVDFTTNCNVFTVYP